MGTEILIGLAISAATSVATSLLAPKQNLLPVDKGRYDDIRVQGSEYGTAIPIVYGRARLAGNIIYSDGVQPHVTTTPGRSGGKLGGGRPPEPPVNHYSYTTNIAVAICEGEVKGGLKRIWENAKVTMGTDTNPLPDGTTIEAELTTNTYSGDVQIVRDLAASGEYKVLLNGSNSHVVFNSFEVPQLGLYNIKIIYMGLGAKTAEVFVDATSKGVISFASTGSDNVSQVKVITHTFTSTGTHTIKIKRDGSNPAPYIDAVGLYGATATATASVSGGAVTSVTVTDGGGGYSTAPLVRFFGTGTGAAATAVVTNGAVSAINVTSGGTGYTSPPSVEITPSVVFTPTQVTGIVNTGASYSPNPDYQYQYYNNTLVPDANGTSSAGLANPLTNNNGDGDPTNPPGGGGGGTGTSTFGQFTFYNGSETQVQDPYLLTLEPGNVPGYRGTCYIVLKDYQIPDGQMPNFTFEVEEGTHDLADILVSLWGRVGLDPSQLDVTSLVGTFVEGLVINTRTALSDILEALCIAYAFDFVDLNGKVTAVKRGGTSVATISESELKAHEDGSEVPVAALETTYVDVKELPKQIDVSYMDRSRSYYQNVQPAIKQIGTNEEPQTLVLPLVLPSAHAKEIGNRVLNTIYLQKAQYNFTLPPKYAWLSPSDIITLNMDNATHTLRIAQFQTGMPGLCKVQAVPDSASLYLDTEFASSQGGAEPFPVHFPAVTQCTFMDIPPLIPEHTGFGFYAAACGSGIGLWNGAHLYREEIPNSNEWLRMGSFEIPAVMGVAGQALNNTTGNYDNGGGKMTDTLSSITVNVYSGTLESYTALDLFNNPNLNLAYIGGEIVQFASATAVGTATSPYVRRYTLTNFRRGLNGTTGKVGSHVAGEDFVMLNSAIQWMRIPAGHLFTDYRYKAVTVGMPVQGAQPITFNTGTGSAPPVASNLSCSAQEVIAPDGTATITIRGTFSFGTFVGGQRAKIFVRRPIGTGASATATISGGVLTGFSGLVGGSGYTVAPTVTLVGGGGTGATATATISGGAVTGFNITNGGSGYTSPPAVVISGSAEATYFNTGIVVLPDATNSGAFELPAAVPGTYYIQVVTTTAFDLSAPSGHPVANLNVSVNTLAPATPTWQSPEYVFDGQTVVWKWIQSTAPNHSHYKVYNGAGTQIAGRVDGNTYAEFPVNGMSRKITAVNLSGIESAFSSTQTLTITAPNDPTSYATAFNGTEVVHTWTAPTGATSQYIYEVADGASSVLATTGATTWVETTTPPSRSYTRKVRASLYGVTSNWVSTTVSIPAPDAPTNVTFNTGLATPFEIPIEITPNGSMNTRQIRTTRVDVMDSTGTTVLQTLNFAGVARSAIISGRFFSTETVIKARVTFVDMFGDGGSFTTSGTYTFTGIAGGDITNGTITSTQLGAGAVISATIANGVLTTAHFASSIRPVQLYSASTTDLPSRTSAPDNTNYPTDSQLYWTNATNLNDRKLWRAEAVTTEATATASVANGAITSINMSTNGSGYAGIPTVRLSGGGGSGAVLTPVMSGNTVASVTVTNGGTGYTSPPTVTFTAWTKRVDASDLVANSVTAGIIAAGAISATEISAGAIRADKLAIGAIPNNLIINSSFEDFSPEPYNASTSRPIGWANVETGGGSADWNVSDALNGVVDTEGRYTLRMQGVGNNFDIGSTVFPVIAGSKYLIRIKLKSAASTGTYSVHLNYLSTTAKSTATRYIGLSTSGDIQARDGWSATYDNSVNLTSQSLSALGGGVVTKDAVWTCPAGVKYVSLVLRVTNPQAPVYFDGVDMRKQVTGVVIEDGTLTANKLVAQTITGDYIAAGTLTVDKFATRVLGDNLILNNGFESYNTSDNKPYNWKHINGGGTPTWSSSTGTTAADGARSLSLLNTGAGATDIGCEAIPVAEGEKYYVSFRAKVPTATAGEFAAVFLELNTALPSNKTYVGAAGISADAVDFTSYSWFVDYANGVTYDGDTTSTYMDTTWKRFESEYTVPVGVKYVTFAVRQTNGTNPIYWDSFVFRKYVPGVVIEDGTVTAPKIKAGSITADKLAIGSFGSNLVFNPSFEDANSSLVPSGWKFAEGTATSITSSTTYVADGAYSGKIDNGNNAAYSSVAFPVVYGENYAVRLKLRSQASSGTYYVRISEYNSTLPTNVRYIGNITSGEVVTRNSYVDLVNLEAGVYELMANTNLTTLNGGFKQKSAVYTPSTSSVKYASLTIYNWSSANAPLYIDDIIIQKKVTGVFIENGTITAENLVIGGMSDNLLINSSFETLSDRTAYSWPEGWERYNTDDFVSLTTSGGRRYMETTDDATYIGLTSKAIPVVPNSKIAVRFYAKSQSSGVAAVRFLFRASMPSTGSYTVKNYIGSGTETVPALSAAETTTTNTFNVTNSDAYYETLVTVPSGKYWMSIAPTNGATGGAIIYDDVTARKQVGQAFISDLRADQIVANVGQIGLIFADQIKQTDFTSYQTGSIYTPDLGFDYTNASGATYDLTSDTISITTSGYNNNTCSVATATWQKIKAGSNGSIEVTVPAVLDANTSFFIGLTANWNPASYGANYYHYAMDYAWYYYGPTSGGHSLFCFEADNNSFSAGTLVAGDVLKVSIEEDYVRFRRNGLLIWTSPYRPSVGTIRDGTRNSVTLDTTNSDYRGVLIANSTNATSKTIPLRFAKLTQEGIGKGWKLNPLSGSQLYADEPVWDTNYDTGNIASNIQVGTYISRTNTAAAWDTSVVTAQQITAGDGWFQTTITDLTTVGHSMIALSNDSNWSSANYNPTATYAIYFDVSTNYAKVYENGAYVSQSVTMTLGDTFRVSLEGGLIKYLKNGAVFYEHSVSPSYPFRGKVFLNSANAKVDQLLFTASSAGLGEFNSGITVRGKRIEDVVKLATQAIRADNRYRGNDSSIPSNIVTSIRYDTYFISWEDGMCFINISVNFSDYKSNSTKNFDSVKHVRARVYNKYGELVKQIEAPYHGRGLAFSGYFPRVAADGKQEAVYSFEFENLYGYSLPIWYSEAKWLDKTAGTWIEAPQNDNISYSAPQWYNRNDIPTNCSVTVLTSTSVQITWTKAVNDSSWSYQVYYRLFKPEGYEGDASNEGWSTAGSTTTNAYKTVTGLQANTRYEFCVKGTTIDYGYSNIAQARTFMVVPLTGGYGAPSGLSGTAISATQIDLTWTKNDTANYVETELWRTSASVGSTPAVPDETATQVGTSLTGTTYSNTSLTANTVYSYRARNKYTGPVYSEWSNVTTVTTPVSSPPTPPTNVSATVTGYYSLDINFTGNNGSVTYRVQVAYAYDTSFSSPVYNATASGVNGANTRSVTGLSAATDYVARVKYESSSDWSSLAYGTTLTPGGGGGGGGGYCVLETESITYVSPEGDIIDIPANTLLEGSRVLGTLAGKKDILPAFVKKATPVVVNGLLYIETSSGANIKCSLAHKPITGFDDTTGVRAETLQIGDSVLVYNRETNLPELDTIVSIEYIAGEFTVIELSLDSKEHTYIAGGIFAHNSKEY